MYIEAGLFGIVCIYAFGVMIGYIIAKCKYEPSDYTKGCKDDR